MSSVTDPYQPIERKVKLTRGLLEILSHHKPKLVVQTRSPDVVRDIDLFQDLENNGGKVQINMTVTTDDKAVRSTFEPFCPSNKRRLAAIKKINETGLSTCITMTPLIWLNNPKDFVERLLDTGVKRFISQQFHFKGGRFVAKTRGKAFDLMAQKLDCPLDEFRNLYERRYQEWRDALKEVLENDGGIFGEGKDGFRPPF